MSMIFRFQVNRFWPHILIRLYLEPRFEPIVTGIPTSKVKASVGSKIWSDRSYTISNMSEKLVGTTLFQTKHYVRRSTIEVSSNRNAFVLIALYEEGNR